MAAGFAPYGFEPCRSLFRVLPSSSVKRILKLASATSLNPFEHENAQLRLAINVSRPVSKGTRIGGKCAACARVTQGVRNPDNASGFH